MGIALPLTHVVDDHTISLDKHNRCTKYLFKASLPENNQPPHPIQNHTNQSFLRPAHGTLPEPHTDRRRKRKMPTLSPLTAILPVLCALTGYYVGKTAGLRAAERTQLAEKDAVQKGSSTPAAKDRKGKGKVVAGGDEEWESEDESSGEIDIKKLENIREDCKMVSHFPQFYFIYLYLFIFRLVSFWRQ